MNLDFSADPLLAWYVVLLFVSGLAMIGIALINSSGLSAGWRAFNGVAGVGFIGYGFYLAFIFQGGTVIFFFKAFILPVVMIVQFVRSLSAKKAKQQPIQFQPGQPTPYQQQPNPYQQPVPPQVQAPQVQQVQAQQVQAPQAQPAPADQPQA
ncbi:hypothetical protein [Kitasatospora azatica]|uniref:hypothetical protein n=1 Tax=Kitasatospora azatica TaxID=58347 RepID=UPI00068E5885|nr:hypothetical protein [Kitasatospora azatica]